MQSKLFGFFKKKIMLIEKGQTFCQQLNYSTTSSRPVSDSFLYLGTSFYCSIYNKATELNEL